MSKTESMRIGEIAQVTGVSARMLRYYEKHGLLAPSARSAAGYREYDDSDVERIFHIEGLRGLGLTVAEVKSALEDPGFSFSTVIDELLAQSRHRLKEERRLYEKLRAVRASGAKDWQAALDVVNLLHNLRSPSPSLRQGSVMRLAPGVDLRQVAHLALTEDNPNVAGALAWSALHAGEAGLEEIARGLSHVDPQVRLRAVQILAQAEDTEDAEGFLVEALDDESVEVRRTVALALGERGEDEAFAQLLDMIVEGDHDTDASDVLAQASGWRERALESIDKLLRDGSMPSAQRVRLTQALAEFADSDEILASLTDDNDSVVAMTAQAIIHARKQRG